MVYLSFLATFGYCSIMYKNNSRNSNKYKHFSPYKI